MNKESANRCSRITGFINTSLVKLPRVVCKLYLNNTVLGIETVHSSLFPFCARHFSFSFFYFFLVVFVCNVLNHYSRWITAKSMSNVIEFWEFEPLMARKKTDISTSELMLNIVFFPYLVVLWDLSPVSEPSITPPTTTTVFTKYVRIVVSVRLIWA